MGVGRWETPSPYAHFTIQEVFPTADIKQDLLSLQYSTSFSLSGMEEANIDLQLSAAPPPPSTLTGVVTDGETPVADATVKVFDSAGMPYQHTLTDASGLYSITGLPAGSYTVAAAKEGYLLSPATGVTPSAGSTQDIPLLLTPEPTLSLGTIAGVLSVLQPEGAPLPLGGAKITLFSSTGETVAVTTSAPDGEFAFYDLADGVYTLTASAQGYLSAGNMLGSVTKGGVVNVTMAMQVDSRTYNGTVSGIIRNSSGQAVAGCFVGLYQVTTIQGVTTETLVATTKTNSEGKYLFGGVLAGDYLVKAKLEQ